jgi:hypothetical protein
LAARKARNFALVPAALNIGFAMSEAASKDLPTTAFLAMQGFVFLKVAERAINTMLEHRNEYYKILNRAMRLKIAQYKNIMPDISKESDKLLK